MERFGDGYLKINYYLCEEISLSIILIINLNSNEADSSELPLSPLGAFGSLLSLLLLFFEICSLLFRLSYFFLFIFSIIFTFIFTFDKPAAHSKNATDSDWDDDWPELMAGYWPEAQG